LIRLAIIHYHLQLGGVTRVIRHILTALATEDVAIVDLTGQPPAAGDWPGDYRVIQGLYYQLGRPPVCAAELASRIEESATEALGGRPDLYHAHNHSLGKNLALSKALHLLAVKGCPMLLHIHDFAEDGRPGNYRLMLEGLGESRVDTLSRLLYPVGGHIHYGLLNSRDRSCLMKAGAPDAHLHLLPNPVEVDSSGGTEEVGDSIDRPLVLYPTRAIRRKNIGEFLLLSAMSSGDYHFATTLGPENPAERPRYEQWRRMSAELALPVTFELACKVEHSFADLLQQAATLITTSVAEGFGLAFLEPWLARRPVCGRDLPEITREFRLQGIQFPWLYERFSIPVEWLGLDRILERGHAGLQRCLAAYGRRGTDHDRERLRGAWIHDGTVDFGRLDETLQEEVIRRVAAWPKDISMLEPASLPDFSGKENIIETNRHQLKEKYSLVGYGRSILRCYSKIADSKSTPLESLDGKLLLDYFLDPERFSLLRVD